MSRDASTARVGSRASVSSNATKQAQLDATESAARASSARAWDAATAADSFHHEVYLATAGRRDSMGTLRRAAVEHELKYDEFKVVHNQGSTDVSVRYKNEWEIRFKGGMGSVKYEKKVL